MTANSAGVVPLLAFLITGTLLLTGCSRRALEQYTRPGDIVDFKTLYSDNCAACHGADGRDGASRPLHDAVYQRWIGADRLRSVTSNGVNGTTMPGFGKAAGGPLTDKQIEILTDTMQKEWAGPEIPAMPPYAGDTTIKSDVPRGQTAYQTFCAECHGSAGTGGKSPGSIIDPDYLALVSDQWIRTTVIAGRPDLHIPDWRSYVPGRPMTSQEVSDVVEWVVSHRRIPSQNMSASVSPLAAKEKR
jgi:mono/diheme cytochrome c family protein